MARASRLADDKEQRVAAARQVRAWSVRDFHALLVEADIHRGFVLFENSEFRLSHKQLLPIQAFFELSHDFQNHEAFFVGHEPGVETIFTAFVHDTRRGLSQGGLRLWPYPTMADVLSDGLRLSQGMTRKNALAGLHWGGGKGIIPLPAHAPSAVGYQAPKFADERQRLFEAYGRFVASLGGVYYTAEDMGTNTKDMDVLLSQNRYTTCISAGRGGSGNPSAHTAWGVLRAIQAAWLHLHGTEELRGVRVAVQGAGNVGLPLLEYLHRAGAKLIVGEFAPEMRQRVREQFPGVDVLDQHEAIFDADATIFSPCARGDVLTAETIPRLKVELVCGAANNQLGEPHDAKRLEERGILYVPDYLCNRMGITNCADEWAGYLEEDIRLAAERVYPDTLRVLQHAKALHISTADAADRLADIAAAELHPIIGHRGRRIVDHLIRSGWSEPDRRNDEGRRTLHRFTPAADEPRIYREAERRTDFSGDGPAIAAMPLSTTARPHLGMFLSAFLMDVEARARKVPVRRVIGLDHGGAALQHAVRAALPYDVNEITRADFVLECHDHHARNDAAIRHQLAQAGIGFDAKRWLDPMSAEGSDVVNRVFYLLHDSGRITHGEYAGYRCPQCATVLVDSEILDSGDGEPRCERCQSPVQREYSLQVFMDLSREARELMLAIQDGAVTFANEKSRNDVLQQLRDQKPICISRQSWWGHELPTNRDQVLSPWFTLAAWSLQAAGWPGDAAPEPIETVFADSAFLARWIVPSQLMALAVYGRTVFRHVEVHGVVQIVERDNEDLRPEEALDEDRYGFRPVIRRMSPRLGNVVEPATLIQRFGADALRLWYLLSLRANDRTAIVLTESNARAARHAVRRLNASLSYLLSRIPSEGTAQPVDDAIVARVAQLAREARAAYPKRRFDIAARAFVQAVDAVAVYARIVEDRGEASGTGEAAARVIRILADDFSPVAPYVLKRFEEEAGPVPDAATPGWVLHLAAITARSNGSRTEVAIVDDTIRNDVAEHLRDVSRVLRVKVTLRETPLPTGATSDGPLMLVEPGAD